MKLIELFWKLTATGEGKEKLGKKQINLYWGVRAGIRKLVEPSCTRPDCCFHCQQAEFFTKWISEYTFYPVCHQMTLAFSVLMMFLVTVHPINPVTTFHRHSVNWGIDLDSMRKFPSWDTGISLTLGNPFLSLLLSGAEVSHLASLQDKLWSHMILFKSKLNSILMKISICFYFFLGNEPAG